MRLPLRSSMECLSNRNRAQLQVKRKAAPSTSARKHPAPAKKSSQKNLQHDCHRRLMPLLRAWECRASKLSSSCEVAGEVLARQRIPFKWGPQLNRVVKLVAVFVLALLFSSTSSGQGNDTSLTGTVTDPSHAAVSNAKITAKNKSTNWSQEVTTDGSGSYSFLSVPIGRYVITVELNGFNTATVELTLETAQKARQDFELQVGQTTQTITVESATQNLSTQDASLGAVINNNIVSDTPLYLRNWDDLLRLVPGVQSNRYTDQSGATSAGRTGAFNVHGVHSLQNDFILDGIDNNTFSENVQELSTQASRPSLDTIQEFKVITNPYSSEFGRSPGAAVLVTTKGGSNEFHGVLYEYLRNNYFDANDFFSNRSGLTKPKNNQNQFGASLGAPIVKNKFFGFFNYEGTRISRGVSRISTVPLPNERIGNFSATAATAAGMKSYQ